MLPPPKGLIVALITPCDERGRIDWASLNRLIERALPFSDGLLVGEGVVGEGFFLSNRLRLELLKGVVEAWAGPKPLFLCPTSDTPEETLSNVEQVSQRFAGQSPQDSIYWVDIPLWYHSNRHLPQFYQGWPNVTPFPIILYNNPGLISRLNRSLKRKNIRTAVLKRLAGNDRIVGLIQAGDLLRTMNYQRAVRARRDFRFYDGEEVNFLNQPSSSGVVSGGANLFPAAWKEIATASLTLSEDPARNLLLFNQSQKLRELSQLLPPNPAQTLKIALHRLALISHPKVFGEVTLASSLVEQKVNLFLQENFSLQLPP